MSKYLVVLLVVLGSFCRSVVSAPKTPKCFIFASIAMKWDQLSYADERIGISKSVQAKLATLKIRTLSELLIFSGKDLKNLCDFSDRNLEHLREKLHRHNLGLRTRELSELSEKERQYIPIRFVPGMKEADWTVFESMGIRTLGDVSLCRLEELKMIKNLNAVKLDSVLLALHTNGLTLRKESIPRLDKLLLPGTSLLTFPILSEEQRMALFNEGVYTYRDLTQLSVRELQDRFFFDASSVRVLEIELEKLGLTLAATK